MSKPPDLTDSEPGPEKSPRRTGFIPRAIAVICGFYGVGHVGVGLLFLPEGIQRVVSLLRSPFRSPDLQRRHLFAAWADLGILIGTVVAGASLLVAAPLWWNVRWRRALTFSLIGLILLMLSFYATAYVPN
jgi:hypothetical protein